MYPSSSRYGMADLLYLLQTAKRKLQNIILSVKLRHNKTQINFEELCQVQAVSNCGLTPGFGQAYWGEGGDKNFLISIMSVSFYVHFQIQKLKYFVRFVIQIFQMRMFRFHRRIFYSYKIYSNYYVNAVITAIMANTLNLFITAIIAIPTKNFFFQMI